MSFFRDWHHSNMRHSPDAKISPTRGQFLHFFGKLRRRSEDTEPFFVNEEIQGDESSTYYAEREKTTVVDTVIELPKSKHLEQ